MNERTRQANIYLNSDPHWNRDQAMSSDAYSKCWSVTFKSNTGLQTDLGRVTDLPEALASMSVLNTMSSMMLDGVYGRYYVRKNR